MEKSETIMEYNGRLMSLANEASVLGDPISNERLVSKVLRSVPKRFHTKVCAIDESKDTSTMGLDELISSVRTYEMELEAKDDSKEKKDVKGAQPSNFPKLPTSEKPQKPAATRGPRQREYKGYGHYAYECANRLRKGMNASLSDDDSEEEQEKIEQADLISFTTLLESKKHFQINPLGVGSGVATPGGNTVQKSVCFVASNLDNSSNHEEQVADPYTLEGIQKLYEELYCDWNKRNQLNSTLTKENIQLKAVVARLEVLMMFVKEGNDFLNHPSTASKGTRSVDNCYQLGEELACRHSKVDEFSLWNQKLGHVNFKTLKNLSKFEAVRGLPNLKAGVSYVCGACQKGKQTRVSHPMLQHCGTTRYLELLHMDLMGHMEVESYGDLKGKTAEDDIEGLLEIPPEEHSVVPDVITPNTTLVLPKTVHEENSQNNEETEVSTEKNISSKIQKNHPSS
ncbi:uncharacterized protein [Henckelia pumila]|uniref:uncharacterized protein n=1 Tax=Henckelia pumila TaxID=405737 RepID=UPI003C6DC09D